MATVLRFEPASSNHEAVEVVEWLAGHVQVVVSGLADRSGMAVPQELIIVLADDFRAEVATRSAGKETSFTVDRIGGLVSGKNLNHPTDPSIGQVILNAHAFNFADTQAGGQVLGAFVLAHELWHPPLTWTRNFAKAQTPMIGQTPDQAARAMARVLGDEYRADILASVVLDTLAGDEPQNREPGSWRDAWLASAHLESVREALTTVSLGWPETIETYRRQGIDLMTMWNTLVVQTNELLTLLAHAEAAAVNAGQHGLPKGLIANLPGCQLHVDEVWAPIATLLHEQTLLPSVDAHAALENALGAATETAVMAMWGRLGLRFDDIDRDTGNFYIHVADPQPRGWVTE